MSEMKHTPGPWKAFHDWDTGIYRVVLDDDSGPGQCVIAELEAQQEDRENAHLIAAAPDLYEALIKVVDAIFAADLKHGLEEQIEQARLAVRKAEGGQP